MRTHALSHRRPSSAVASALAAAAAAATLLLPTPVEAATPVIVDEVGDADLVVHTPVAALGLRQLRTDVNHDPTDIATADVAIEGDDLVFRLTSVDGQAQSYVWHFTNGNQFWRVRRLNNQLALTAGGGGQFGGNDGHVVGAEERPLGGDRVIARFPLDELRAENEEHGNTHFERGALLTRVRVVTDFHVREGAAAEVSSSDRAGGNTQHTTTL